MWKRAVSVGISVNNRTAWNLTRLFSLASTSSKVSDISLPQLLMRKAKESSRKVAGQRETKCAASNWKDIVEIEDFLSGDAVSSRDLSVIAWSINQLGINEGGVWEKIVGRVIESDEIKPGELAAVLFALSNAVTRDPLLLNDFLKKSFEARLRSLSDNANYMEALTLADCAQSTYSLSCIFPESSVSIPFVKQTIAILNRISRSTDSEELPQLKSCKEVTLLWSAARNRKKIKSKLSVDFVSTLSEVSRGLRLCEDFNQNKVAQLSETLAILGLKDPRVVYQVILFVDKNKDLLNANNLLRIVRSMSKLGVDNEVFWKRIASRLEEPLGLKFSLKDLEDIRRAFVRQRNNQRIIGILDLYIKTKADQTKYGPM